MNSSRSKIHRARSCSPEIIDLRMETDGSFLTLRCWACGDTFEGKHTTVASITIGRYICPQCRTLNEVWPDDFEAALDRDLPARSIDEMIRLTEEATRITETWYQVEPLAELLDYRGVNLGEGPERELAAFVVQGLLKVTEKKRDTDGL